MNETSIALPHNSINGYESEDCESDYQVDTISTASCQDEENHYSNETKDALAVTNQSQVPHFKSVSVVNSNDVHFGNKTVYKGPVTIKQFVYPNGEVIKSQCVSGFEENDNNVDTKNTNNGVYNPTFVRDEEKLPDKSVAAADSFDQFDRPNLLQRINKGFHCCPVTVKNYRYKIPIFIGIIILVVTIVSAVLSKNLGTHTSPSSVQYSRDAEEDNNTPVEFVKDPNTTLTHRNARLLKRLQWLAQPPTGIVNNLTLPVSIVIIQHTATESCSSQAQCIFQTRTIQTFHIESHGWFDIGYNFLIGGDGAIYEGRGWTKEGAHTFSYNNISIGISFIGTYTQEVPPSNMIESFHQLVKQGVDLNYLTPDYRILAHRQLIGSESPGLAFFEQIKKWPHWSSNINKLVAVSTG